ncbi:head protein [Salmonella enterica subsp. enterica]|nr:head protein [Salmonella enterica subsp. enterica]
MGERDINAVIMEASSAFSVLFEEGANNVQADYPMVATTFPSHSASTGYGFLSEFPMLKEWVGDRMIKSLADHDYAIKNKLFEASIGVSRTDFEDNDYGKYGPLFSEMGMQGTLYPDEHIFSLLKKGTEELCFDGKPFFSKEHPLGDETASNLFEATKSASGNSYWYLIDNTRALKPLLWQERIKPAIENTLAKGGNVVSSHVFLHDKYMFGVRARGNAGFSLWQLASASNLELTMENFESVYDSMCQFKSDSGRPMRIRPSLLVVPQSLRSKARAIIEKEFLSNGESNPNFKIVDILVSPWL